MTNKLIVDRQTLDEIILEECKILLKEERVKNLQNNYNKLSLKEKKECKKIGFHFFSNLHESKIIDSKTFNQIILSEGVMNWAKNKAMNFALDKMGPAGQIIRKINMIKGDDLIGILQTALDLAGFVPGLGDIADGINVAISALRKDYVGAALSAVSMIPGLGDVIAKPIKALLKAGKGIPFKYIQKILPALEKFGPTLIQKAKTVISKLPFGKEKMLKMIPSLENGLKIAAQTLSGSAEQVAGKVGNLAANKIKDTAKKRKQQLGTPTIGTSENEPIPA